MGRNDYKNDNDRLLAFLDGTMSNDEQAQLRSEIERSPELRTQIDELSDVRGLLREAVVADADARSPLLADRVIQRMRSFDGNAESVADAFLSGIVRLFRPVALAAIVIIALLASYNLSYSDEYASELTTAESVLGLPPVTLATAYDVTY